MIAAGHIEMYRTAARHLATFRHHPDDGHDDPEAAYVVGVPYRRRRLASRMIATRSTSSTVPSPPEGVHATSFTTPERPPTFDVPRLHPRRCRRPHRALVPPPSELGPDLRSARGGARRPGRRQGGWQGVATAGIGPTVVDCCGLRRFSFEVDPPIETFGFCGPGEGPDFVMEGNMAPGGRFPTCTDGGLLSFSHSGGSVQQLQRIVRGVQQLQGRCASHQVERAEVALCSGGGAGALHEEVILLGVDRP